MSMPLGAVDRNGLEVLSREACLRLVRLVPVGRVGVVVGGIPVVVPVNFAIWGEDVVFRTGTGDKLVAAVSRNVVTFEVDSVDLGTRSGWSVLLTGGASEITRPDERAAVGELGLESWVPGRGRYIRIRADEVSGRRIVGTGHRGAIPETDWNWG